MGTWQFAVKCLLSFSLCHDFSCSSVNMQCWQRTSPPFLAPLSGHDRKLRNVELSLNSQLKCTLDAQLLDYVGSCIGKCESDTSSRHQDCPVCCFWVYKITETKIGGMQHYWKVAAVMARELGGIERRHPLMNTTRGTFWDCSLVDFVSFCWQGGLTWLSLERRSWVWVCRLPMDCNACCLTMELKWLCMELINHRDKLMI